MASKKALNAQNLEALGPERLAELLLEISTGNAVAKRRLRLELAAQDGPAEVAREVRKRLATIARSRSFVEWHNQQSLIDDLETQRRAIVDQVAKRDPAEGLDLMWRFLELAPSVYERCEDGGAPDGTFERAVNNLGEIATSAKPNPMTLADDVLQALIADNYGLSEPLIRALAPTLGRKGLAHLTRRLQADLSDNSMRRRLALMYIADVQGDADAWIAQYDAQKRKNPIIAAAIAHRLLAADRAAEALQAIDAAEHRPGDREDWGDWLLSQDFEWEDARIAALEALGRHADAQQQRWTCFERSLSAEHLRAYLERLPDFDDLEAEERALDHARNFRQPIMALAFLASWTALDRTSVSSQPALDRAADLVVRQGTNLDGNQYEILTAAADALSAKHPFAATLALRAMIDFALARARSSRYKHAARHFTTCTRLASAIEDFGAFESHDVYEARLRREHGRKSAFWSQVR